MNWKEINLVSIVTEIGRRIRWAEGKRGLYVRWGGIVPTVVGCHGIWLLLLLVDALVLNKRNI